MLKKRRENCKENKEYGEKVRQRLEVAGEIYEQQKTMYKEKVNWNK